MPNERYRLHSDKSTPSSAEGKKLNTCQKTGGHQHGTTPAGQILGGRDPCNPCGVDAYGHNAIAGSM